MRNFIKGSWTRFRQDKQGAILPLFALLVILLVVIGGSAIDVSRAVNAREKLSYAIDAAALSLAVDLSGKIMTDGEIRTALSNSFKANLEDSDWRATAIKNIDFVVDSDEGTVTVSSTSHLNNYFVDMGGYGIKQFGPENFSFGTSATVNYSRFNLELAMTLDVTGSMQGNFGVLRDSSRSFVNILLPDDAPSLSKKVRIALVPYAQGVRVSHQMKRDLWAYNDKVDDGTYCLTDRIWARETDGPYTNTRWKMSSFVQSGRRQVRNGVLQGRDPYGLDYDPPADCPAQEIVPLTSNKRTLNNAIDNLRKAGGTGGQTGNHWAWNLLSPNWAGLLPHASQPAEYDASDDADVKKIAVLMTDGEFNMWWNHEQFHPPLGCAIRNNVYSCTTKARYGITEYYEDPLRSMNTPSVQRGLEYCDQMKSKGIEIYTVFFETRISRTPYGKQLMKECASSSDRYYEASSADELRAAFEKIAKKIQKIYLSR